MSGVEVMLEGSIAVAQPADRREIDALWRWRGGIGLAADAVLGGKVSEDIAVPVDRLANAGDAIREIARRRRLGTCSWGHAGDGNLHATFLFTGTDHAAHDRAVSAAEELFNPKGLLNPGKKCR